jgi:hypothetical protein
MVLERRQVGVLGRYQVEQVPADQPHQAVLGGDALGHHRTLVEDVLAAVLRSCMSSLAMTRMCAGAAARQCQDRRGRL